jgi:nitrite reductase/ring-hydroxylating ferredoxin subunit
MTRREWLKKTLSWGFWGVLGGSVGAIFLDVWLAAGRFSSIHWNQIVRLSELPADGTFAFPQQRVALLRSDSKLAALSLECTHLGCLVNSIDQGFYCPCHGSEFGRLGEVYSGPATRSLPWHAIRITAGSVWIQSGVKHSQPLWISLNQDSASQETGA